MFERLAQIVDEVEIPVDGAAIAEALAIRDRLDAAIAEALGEFDDARLWNLDACRSLADWLRINGRCSGGEAARLASTARRCRRLPVTAAAWRRGDISTAQVRAVMAHVDDKRVDAFGADEEALVPLLAPLTVRESVVAMQEWRERVAQDDGDPPEEEQHLHLSQTFGGTWAIKGGFGAASGQVVQTALRLAGCDEVDGERIPAERRADAMVDIAQFFLDHHDHPTGSRHRPHVNLVVQADRLPDHDGARFLDGMPVSPVDAAAFTCDSVISRVLMAGSTVLDYGRATRVISPALWNALLLRDRHCRFGECEVPGHRCHAHHVVPWEDGGETSLANLSLECRRHHRLVHMPGWEAKLLPDGTYVVTDPNGRTRTSRPPGPPGGLL